jgi:hypothetical protein
VCCISTERSCPRRAPPVLRCKAAGLHLKRATKTRIHEELRDEYSRECLGARCEINSCGWLRTGRLGTPARTVRVPGTPPRRPRRRLSPGQGLWRRGRVGLVADRIRSVISQRTLSAFVRSWLPSSVSPCLCGCLRLCPYPPTRVNFWILLPVSTSAVYTLPFESRSRLCTQPNWPAFRPPDPK